MSVNVCVKDCRFFRHFESSYCYTIKPNYT
ncbi:hypothetical protein VPHK469_0215 [Vibrio phage K469]